MKIAVTSENGQVFQHFGRTQLFELYTVEDGKILAKELLDTSMSGHEALAVLLRQAGVSLLICGGVGTGAQNALRLNGIELVAGASGSTDLAVADYLAGRLLHNPLMIHTGGHHGEGHSCGPHKD